MLNIVYSTQFKKDFKKVKKRSLHDLKILFEVILKLENQEVLDIQYKDHELTGNWSEFRECHIKPDWLLIYKITNDTLLFARIGSHSDLFR